ncbi:hypothetical protein BC830DRAFT_775777 [Chytriomyces sp. MP71]|nr:hypothetical protein BC830DRAFT_775777 [Chytriomyces sp. MP71]
MSMPSPLATLPDAALIRVLRYCDTRHVVQCAQLNVRLRALCDTEASLWRHVSIGGASLASLSRFVDVILLVHADAIASISLENILFDEKDSDAFLRNLDRLLACIGSALTDLRIDDTLMRSEPDSIHFRLPVPASALAQSAKMSMTLFGQIDPILTSLASHCASSLKRIVLSGNHESIYIGDDAILFMTTHFPSIESFTDEQSCGLTPTALKYMADGWSRLTSLELDTECMHLDEFGPALTHFGPRLHRLSVTTFSHDLDAAAFPQFTSALQALPNLHLLAIDHSTARGGQDGIDPDRTRALLAAAPSLRGIEYFASLEAFFDFADDEDDFRAFSRAGSPDGPASLADTDLLLDTYRTYRAARSTYTRSRRGSLGSMSMATTRFGPGGLRYPHASHSLSLFSKEEERTGDDVTSLAPGMPSPHERLNRVEVYGAWSCGDGLGIRARALRILGFDESGSDFFVGRQETFFAILEGVWAVCEEMGVKVTFAWSI